jgi:hypothetical protein
MLHVYRHNKKRKGVKWEYEKNYMSERQRKQIYL